MIKNIMIMNMCAGAVLGYLLLPVGLMLAGEKLVVDGVYEMYDSKRKLDFEKDAEEIEKLLNKENGAD